MELDSDWQELQSRATPELLTSKVSPALAAERSASAAALTARSQELDAEARELLAIPAGNLTNAQMRRIIEINLGFAPSE